MKNHMLLALLGFILVQPVLFGQANPSADRPTSATPPAIPEEARKHFVMGTTLFKDAKTADDYSQVVSEFKQAAELAPQWPDARYNLALAKEASADYSGAMADLKLYQQFKLSESEARTVQDKIYALEAKAGAATRRQAEEHRTSAAEEQKKHDYQDKIGFLEGQWNCRESKNAPDGTPTTFDCKVTIAISGKNITFTRDDDNKPFVRGIMKGEDYTSIKWMAADNSKDKNYEGSGIPPAEDTPIDIVVDKVWSRIQWQEPQLVLGFSNVYWSLRFGPAKYTLTR